MFWIPTPIGSGVSPQFVPDCFALEDKGVKHSGFAADNSDMANAELTVTGIDRLRAAIALGIDLKVGELVDLQKGHADGEVVELLRSDIAKAASHPDLDPAIHECLTNHQSNEVRFGAAFHPRVSLAERDEYLAGLHASQLTPDVVDHEAHRWLAQHENLEFRKRVARSWAAPTDVVSLLASDEDETVRRHAAGNPNADPTLLARLARDESLAVAGGVISNRNVDTDLLDELSERLPPEDFAGCKKCSPALAAQVVDSFGWDTAEGVSLSLNAADDLQYRQRTAILNLPLSDAQLTMVWDGVVGVDNTNAETLRRNLAGNRALSHSLAKRVAREGCVVARRKLAENPAISEEVQRILFDDEDSDVTGYLAGNPSIIQELRDATLERGWGEPVAWLARNKSATPDELLKLRSRMSSNSMLCEFLAVHPRTPSEMLSELADHDDPKVRLRVASNYSASDELRDRLADDDDASVSQHATGVRSLPFFMDPVTEGTEWFGKARIIFG